MRKAANSKCLSIIRESPKRSTKTCRNGRSTGFWLSMGCRWSEIWLKNAILQWALSCGPITTLPPKIHTPTSLLFTRKMREVKHLHSLMCGNEISPLAFNNQIQWWSNKFRYCMLLFFSKSKCLLVNMLLTLSTFYPLQIERYF